MAAAALPQHAVQQMYRSPSAAPARSIDVHCSAHLSINKCTHFAALTDTCRPPQSRNMASACCTAAAAPLAQARSTRRAAAAFSSAPAQLARRGEPWRAAATIHAGIVPPAVACLPGEDAACLCRGMPPQRAALQAPGSKPLEPPPPLPPLNPSLLPAGRRQGGCLRVQAMLTAEKSELDVSKVWGCLQRRLPGVLLQPACRLRRLERPPAHRSVDALCCFVSMWFPPSQMAPLGDRILVKPQEVEKQTAGGILLAPTSGGGRNMQDALVGTGGWSGQRARLPQLQLHGIRIGTCMHACRDLLA